MLASLLFGLLTLRPVQAEPIQAGYRDFSFGLTVKWPTAEQTQSKLWWNDGRWWGSLYNPSANAGAGAYTVHELDLSAQTWADTGTIIDPRPTTHMDVLWDSPNQKLYVVSSPFPPPPKKPETPTGPAHLYRFSYGRAAKRYSLDGGFPVTVRESPAGTITIARDSTGRLWITYVQERHVWVNRSIASDIQWGRPFVLGANVDEDDTAAVVAFQGDKISVIWSNVIDKKMYFAVHRDGDPDTSWQPPETVLPGPGQNPGDRWVDNHINLKQDGSGRLFAAVKTSLRRFDDPLIMLLVRDRVGNWSNYVVSRVEDNHTRPIVLIDDENACLYMFATGKPGGIYVKATPLAEIRFERGRGTPFILSDSNLKINDATSTKQTLNSRTGLLVLAAAKSPANYFHNYVPPPKNLPARDCGFLPVGATKPANP